MIRNPLQQAFYKICDQIQFGTLYFTSPEGDTTTFGQGQPTADLVIKDWSVVKAVILRGDIGLGESYVDGLWESSNIEALILLVLTNQQLMKTHEKGSPLFRLIAIMRDRLIRRNSRRGSRKNIRSHYDVGNDFYQLWLDETMTYSSALYQNTNSLPEAQRRKYQRLMDMVEPSGDRVLEIGCGWGGFAEHAADAGADVTAITISPSQHQFAQRRLGQRADIQLTDYRDVKGLYDGIVSIEMIEAVGMKYWPDYFRTLKSRLADNGKIALQAIIVEDVRFDAYKNQSDFIRQYTFPGGMLISPGQIQKQAEQAGLQVNEMIRFGKDYARTLREWFNRFEAAESDIRALGYDTAFIRSWRYYLQICSAAFENNLNTNVVHVEMSHA